MASSHPMPHELALTAAQQQVLLAQAPDADAQGTLLPSAIALIHASGWLKMLAPAEVGGQGRALPEVVRLEEALCGTDGSCGWLVTLCAGAGWFSGFWPPALAREVLATPQLCLAGSGAPSGRAEREGAGWRISGHWRHASGSQIATHYTFNAQLFEHGQPLRDASGQPRVCAFVVPAAQVQIEPGSWHSIGLRASTSCAFSVQQLWVPESQAFVIDAAHAQHPGPLYRFAFDALAWVTLSACVLGMARQFIALAEPLCSRPLPHLGGPSAHLQALHAARSQAVAAAREAFYATLDAAWAQVCAGRTLEAAQSAQLRECALAVVQQAREAVDALYPGCGLQAADPRSHINRVWRDLHTASQHVIWQR